MPQVLKKFSHGMRRWLVGDEISPGLLGNRQTFDQLVKLGHIGEAAPPAAAEQDERIEHPAVPAATAAPSAQAAKPAE
jgi:hypothetical protein